MKPADAYIETHVSSFIQRVQDESREDPSPNAFPNAVAQMEFFSEEEWERLKSALDTDDDTSVIAHIEEHSCYKDMLVPKLGKFLPTIRLNDRPNQFCVIDVVIDVTYKE
jgi:hypothetical protein